MLRMNQNMRSMLADHYGSLKLENFELSCLLNDGLIYSEKLFLISSLFHQRSGIKVEDCHDLTSYECSINSIHIDDYADHCFMDYAYSFIQKLYNDCCFKNSLPPIICIACADEFGLNIRFHLKRSGETWLEENIEDYREAVFVGTLDEVMEYFKK